MKRSITYREVTVAIGIVVALVVALTLWIGLPEAGISGFQAPDRSSWLTSIQVMFETVSMAGTDKPY